MDEDGPNSEAKYAALVQAAATSVIGLDFDGTLAHIVEDPEAATIHPGARRILLDLAGEVAAVAVVTGRPAQQAIDLGGFEKLGDALEAADRHLYVVGQYGNERWSSSDRRIQSAAPPAGLAAFEEELPGVLERVGAAEAFVERKGLAVAIHTRRLPDPQETFERVLPELRDLAERHDLSVEPGKQVVEVRGAGTHKGHAIRELVADTGVSGFLFAGDDLGDIEAFEALDDLAGAGLATLRVSSDASLTSPLRSLVDIVVDGPDGVLALLETFLRDVRAARH
ncbi:trehalose-phosphatase [Nocardioides salsibiostraticola]